MYKLSYILHSRFGRNNFQEAAKLANRAAPVDIDWGKFKYMVFDIPKHSGNYSQRYQELGNCIFPLDWKIILTHKK